MTAKRFRYRPKIGGSEADTKILDTERAALMYAPCPPDGNVFHHLATRYDVCLGKGRGRAVYERHRKDILPAFIAAHPGCRPPAWWQYDAPPDAPCSNQLYDGVQPPEWTLEVQARYLHAHGMLTPEERKKLPREWFAPVPPQLKVIE